ncbi:MAG: hypothetical protein K2M43_03205 [Mycoplasmoidaceae bacterium]|nr:hypothetical protein [Mycoplasmoidaceae bacterium]
MANKKEESAVTTKPAAKAKSEVKKTSTKKRSPRTAASDKKKVDANSPRDFQTINKSIQAKIDDFFEANKDSGIKKLISVAKLTESGCHIGMSTK